MLNFCAKTLTKCQPLTEVYKILTLHNYATFTVKDVLYETSDEAGTLLSRFAKHIAMERQKVCIQVPTNIKYADYFPISDLKYFQKELYKTPNEQIAAVIIFASTYRSNADPGKFASILNELDKHALDNIEQMNMDTILRTLYAFLFLMPNWMTRLDFYGRAMQRLYEEFNNSKDGTFKSKENFVQLCFYMGLNKRQTKYNLNELLKSLLEAQCDQYFANITTLDFALITNAAYKTSTVVKNDAFNQRLLKEVLNISDVFNGNCSLLVTFMKSMRLQRLRSSIVCEYIANICRDKDKLKQLQARGQVHLFAYLAENLWDSKDCTRPLIEAITEHITQSHNLYRSYAETVRGKDIATFLWSCAQLNCSLSSIQFRTIENSLLTKLQNKEFNYFADQLVDSCLSLWILGYPSKELLQAATKLKSESPFKRQQPKVDSRLTILLSAAQIEEPAWCSNTVKGFDSYNLKTKIPSHAISNPLVNYQKIISQLLKEEGVLSANLSCPISGINIPGIHIKFESANDSELFLEFMTPLQTLHFSQEPAAVLRLKVRLLQSLGHKVKVLSSENALNPQSIKNIVSDTEVQGIDIKEPTKKSIKN